MTKIKICGITNLKDARLSVEAGADALGFNFFDRSPRYVSPADAEEIIGRLDTGVSKVGVFVNESIENIAAIVDAAGLDAVQLHGDESTSFVDELRKRLDCDLIKAFRVSGTFRPEVTLDYNVHGILLDGFSKDSRGGTGETFDWDVAKLVGTLVGQLWLAGGLTPGNVRLAIAEVGPYAVDACSSIESRPGIKDETKLRKFISEAKSA